MNLVLVLLVLAPASCFTDVSTYEETPYSCPDGTKLSSTEVCDGKGQCSLDHEYADLYDEDYNVCVDYRNINLSLDLLTQSHENGTIDLLWLRQEAQFNNSEDGTSGSHGDNANVSLAGYFLTASSDGHTLKDILEPSQKEHGFTSLEPWTNYKFILRPFYTSTGKTNETFKIGKAAVVELRTPPAAPPRPSDLTVFDHGNGNMYLVITDPHDRRGERSGHRVRWKLHEGSVDVEGQEDFGKWELTPHANWVEINLVPGRYYTLYISALNKGNDNTNIAGPEMETEVITNLLEPVELTAQSMAPKKIYATWHSRGFEDSFLVAVCNSSCPSLSNNFSPSMHAFHLLAYVHGSLEEQITQMSERFRMNYVLVKVQGGGKEPSEHNVLVETPVTYPNPVVSVANCYMNKCSHSVTKKVTNEVDSLTEPTKLKLSPISNEKALVSWTAPQQLMTPGMGYEVTWLCQPGGLKTTLVSDSRMTLIDFPPNATCNVWVASYKNLSSGQIQKSVHVEIFYASRIKE